MTVLSAKFTFYIAHSTSLKTKRSVCRSIIDKARQKWGLSVAEVDTQDVWQTLTIGVALVSGSHSHARQIMGEVVRFMETQQEAELTEIEEVYT